MRYLLLVVLAAIFLTGLVWWVVFIANAIRGALHR